MKISKDQRLQLAGLLTLARHAKNNEPRHSEYVSAMGRIAGDSSIFKDAIWGDTSLDDALQLGGVEVMQPARDRYEAKR